MPRFIDTCACEGRRPSGCDFIRHHPRPELIARMLRDRHVARCIIAPSGFGKTSLVFEYADIVFGFQHTFWVNGRSPCFLRDLDARTLYDSITSYDSQCALVVFEDVPHLDSERAALFSRIVDDMLERGIEVIATGAPSADVLASSQRDRIVLDAYDLLLSDDELIITDRSKSLSNVGILGPAERIPCLRWGNGEAKCLVAGLKAEELPSDVCLAMFAMLIVGSAMLDDLLILMTRERLEESAELIERSYPLFGVDLAAREFDSVSVSFAELSHILASRIDELAASCSLSDRDELCFRIAELMLRSGDMARACDFVDAFATRRGLAVWLHRFGWLLVHAGEIVAFEGVYACCRRSAGPARASLATMRSWGRMMIGDEKSACDGVRSIAQCDNASANDRLCAGLILWRSRDESLSARGRQILSSAQISSPDKARSSSPSVIFADDWMDWPMLADLSREIASAPARALDVWLDYATEDAEMLDHARMRALLLSYSWLEQDVATNSIGGVPLARVRMFAETLLESSCLIPNAGWYAYAAASRLEERGSVDARSAAFSPSAPLEELLASVRISLERQRDLLVGVKRTPSATQAPSSQVESGKDDSVPVLRVTLFGGLGLYRSGSPVAEGILGRRKAIVLLAALVISRGKEVSRERLAALLWPGAMANSARRNLYSVTSQLRKALALEDGTCPYLQCTRGGCRIDARYVESDLYEFEDLCNALQFGTADQKDWERFYVSVRSEFAEDLMPAEKHCEFLSDARERLRMRLVDGLIAASIRLAREGEDRGSLWLAREALDRDRSREDAYVTLMQAQLASGQRGAAIDTYFSCRRYLSEELGIDPSLRVIDLYRSIIETETEFV